MTFPLCFLLLCIAATPVVQALDWSKVVVAKEMNSIISCVWDTRVLVDIVEEEVTSDQLVAETQAQADYAMLVVCTYLDRFCFFVSVFQRDGTWTLTRIGAVKEFVSKQDAISAAQTGAELYNLWNPFAKQEMWVNANMVKVTWKDQPYPLSWIWFLPDGNNLVGIDYIEDKGSRFVAMSYADVAKTKAIVKNFGSLREHHWQVEEDVAKHLVSVHPFMSQWLDKNDCTLKYGSATVTRLEALGSEVALRLQLSATPKLGLVQPTGDALGDKFLVIFSDGLPATLVAVENVRSPKPVLTYMYRWKSAVDVTNSTKTYYAMALTTEFRDASDDWWFSCEMPHNDYWKHVNWNDLAQYILAEAPFTVARNEGIYLQKGRQMKHDKNKIVAIYSCMGKLFMVAFRNVPRIEKSITVLYISSLGSDKELAKLYKEYINSENAFKERVFKNSIGILDRMPANIQSNLGLIFASIKAYSELARENWKSTDANSLEQWLIPTECGHIPQPPYRTNAIVTWFALLCKVSTNSTTIAEGTFLEGALKSPALKYFYRIAVFYDSVYQGVFEMSDMSGAYSSVDEARTVLHCGTVRPLHAEMLANSKLEFN